LGEEYIARRLFHGNADKVHSCFLLYNTESYGMCHRALKNLKVLLWCIFHGKFE
jgi:hypothetical protein